MKQRTIKIFTLLLVLIITAPLYGLGCGQTTATAADDDRPFYDDRVVTVQIKMTDADWEYTCRNAMLEQYVKADLLYDDELIPDVAVRPKGNSSLSMAVRDGDLRFGLKVDLNFFNSARNLYGIKKLNFSNGFSDPTLIRETLAYELYEQMDIPTPRTSFVDLWVNDLHLGVYTMVEQVDQTFINRNFDDTNGNLYKPEMPAAYLNWTEEDLNLEQEEQNTSRDNIDTSQINLGGGNLDEIMRALDPQRTRPSGNENAQQRIIPGEQFRPRDGAVPPQQMMPPEGFQLPENFRPQEGFVPGQNMPRDRAMIPGGLMWNLRGNYLEQMGLKTNENKPDYSLLYRFLDILNNEPDETFPAEIEKVMDVDEVLRFLAVSTVIVHLDNYIGMGHNYYLYENDGKFVIIPWDLNMAFGTFNSGIDRDGVINFYIDEPTAGPVADRPLVDRLLSYQPYLNTYHEYIKELVDGPFATRTMDTRIDELAGLIRPHVINDELKFYSTQHFEQNLEEDIAGGRIMGGNPLGLKLFIKERNVSIRQQLIGTRESCSEDGSGNGGSGFGVFRNRNQDQQIPVLPQNQQGLSTE
jgi:spore coat protein CotH